ncbi:MAG: CopD family protein [Gemmatimonadaceae bacterium]|nr:CopD family protein [Gemmatimonadaceae bacterium]
MDGDFGVESPVFVGIRAVLSACGIGLIGVLALRFGILARYQGPDREALRDSIHERLRRWIDVLGLTALAGTLARLVAQHAAVFGPDAVLDRGALATLLMRSGWGRSWWLAAGSSVAITWLAPRLRGPRPIAWSALVLATLMFVISQPWSGHPAASPQPALAILTQTLHVISAGCWLGGLAFVTLLAIPAAARLSEPTAELPDARIAGLVRAFSPVALGATTLLVTSGAFTAVRNLGTVSALTASQYGRTLVIKLALVALVAGIGAFNWRRVLPRLGQPAASAQLRRSARLEIVVSVLVVIVTAILVATPMPGE